MSGAERWPSSLPLSCVSASGKHATDDHDGDAMRTLEAVSTEAIRRVSKHHGHTKKKGNAWLRKRPSTRLRSSSACPCALVVFSTRQSHDDDFMPAPSFFSPLHKLLRSSSLDAGSAEMCTLHTACTLPSTRSCCSDSHTTSSSAAALHQPPPRSCVQVKLVFNSRDCKSNT